MHRHRLVHRSTAARCSTVSSADSRASVCSAGCFSTHTIIHAQASRLVHRSATAAQCNTVSVLIRASVAAALVVSARTRLDPCTGIALSTPVHGSVQHSISADSSISGCSAGVSARTRLDPCTGIALTVNYAQCSTVSVLIRASAAALGCFARTTRSMHRHRLVHRSPTAAQCSTVSSADSRHIGCSAGVQHAYDSIHARASPCPLQMNCSSIAAFVVGAVRASVGCSALDGFQHARPIMHGHRLVHRSQLRLSAAQCEVLIRASMAALDRFNTHTTVPCTGIALSTADLLRLGAAQCRC
jgi:hypothetical protein